MRVFISPLLCTAFFLACGTLALDVDINSVKSISAAAKTIVSNIISIYDGGNGTAIPGLFPAPYYWWESGLAWDSLIEYWALTNDDTYNDRVQHALLWQVGPNRDYMPPNQTASEGNDDQSTWALACMNAEERGFPKPPKGSGVDSWLQLAQNVFEDQVGRWDDKTCGGGLRWQIFTSNNGYNYKNALSNGNFMQLAARLAHYTGNQTYTQWAERVSKWSLDVGLIDQSAHAVWDGFNVEHNCSQPNRVQWTANLGTYLSGYAYLSNSTAFSTYLSDITSLLHDASKSFVIADILTETACQGINNCATQPFRAIAARALATTKYFDPQSSDSITPILQASAKGAAAQCSGGKSGNICGTLWSDTKWDGTTGLSEELNALEILLANIDNKAVVQTKSDTSTSPSTTKGSGSSSGSAPSTGANSSPKPTGAGTGAAVRHGASLFGLIAAAGFVVAYAL